MYARRITGAATMISGSVCLFWAHLVYCTRAVELLAEDQCALMQLHRHVKSRKHEVFKACDEVVTVKGYQKPMPAVGYGTAGRSGPELINGTKTYLALGGRLIDTAEAYMNLGDVGVAIRESGIPRKDIWITAKVMVRAKHNFSDVVKTVDEALKELSVDYIDLMLLHGPAGPSIEFFTALLAAKAAGKIRNAGVSNFNQELLEKVISVTGEVPAVNQIEFHPWVHQSTKDLVKWMHRQRIAVTGYDVLGGFGAEWPDAVVALADRYQVSESQLLIRWALDKGVAPLFSSITKEHIEEDLNCSGLQRLSAEDTHYLESSKRPDDWTEYAGNSTMPH